ncbi:MAG: immunoglobulin-like domain-containing protein [Gammaproteobacteria bacterium]
MRILIVVGVLALAGCGGSSGGGSTPAPPPPADTTAPVITLNGNATINVAFAAAYRESGASAQDNSDGTVPVVIDGAVDTKTPGSYTITYTATDVAGNQSQSLRTVIVEPQRVTLRVSTIGDGTYTLDSGMALDCSARPGECLATFNIGTSITVNATADAGQTFVEWLNCDTTNATSCTVEMTKDRTVLSTIASSAPVELQPGVVALTSDQIDSILDFDPDQDRLEFIAGADLSGLAVGNVLVSNGTASSPIYFGRRVLSVTQGAGGNTLVATRNATLVEIVRSGTVVARPQLDGTVQRSGSAERSNPGRISSVASRDVAGGIALEFSGEDEIVLYSQGNDKVSLVGSAGIEPTYQAVFDIEDTGLFLPSIKAWRLYADTNISASVALRVQGEVIQGLGFDENIPVGPTFRYVSTVETAVPIVFQVQPVVGIQAGFEFAAESGLEVSLNDLQTGIQWHRDVGLTPLFSGGQTEFTPLNFLDTVVGAAFLDVAPGANTSALVLGVTGPVLSVGGFGNANLVFDPGAECEISLYTNAGLRFSVAGELELYFWDYSVEFIGADLTLFSDTPFPCSPASSDNGTDSEPPGDVAGLTILAPSAPGGLTVTWSEATDNVAVAFYRAWRFNSSDLTPQPAPIDEPVATQLTDLWLLGDTRYCYYVTAVDGAGNESALPSNDEFVCETTLSDSAQPQIAAPILAPATPDSATSIALEWTFSSGSDTEFTVYDVTSNANPLPVAVTTDTAFNVDGLTTNQTYCFSILAIDGLGRPSAQSNVECAIPTVSVASESGWAVLAEGDPGTPGDGISVFNGGVAFLDQPFYLGPDNDGITMTQYVPNARSYSFTVRFIDSTVSCRHSPFGSDQDRNPAPIINGVSGESMSYSRSRLEQIAADLRQSNPIDCGAATADNAFFSQIDYDSGAGGSIDGIYLGAGAEVYPSFVPVDPPSENAGWITFVEGNAGVPADGVLVEGVAPCPACPPQHTVIEQVLLGDLDGLTISVYGSQGEPLESLRIRFAGLPEVCEFELDAGGFNTLPAPQFNGAPGVYFPLASNFIESLADIVALGEPQSCASATGATAYFSSFVLNSSSYLVDGAFIGRGTNVLPGD